MKIQQSQVVLSRLKKMLSDSSTSDIAFIVGGEKILAHRLTVGTSSAPFKAMFYGKMREAYSSEFVLDDPLITPTVFKKFLEYIYCGETETDVSTVFGLRYLANIYDFQSLFTICDYVCSNVDNKNCISIYNEAHFWNDEEIEKKCIETLVENVKEVLSSLKEESRLLEISYDLWWSILQTGVGIDEIELFIFLIDWINHKTCTKEQERSLIYEIRYGCISQKDLVTVVKPLDIVPLDLYTLALEFHAYPEGFSRPELPNFNKERLEKISIIVRHILESYDGEEKHNILLKRRPLIFSLTIEKYQTYRSLYKHIMNHLISMKDVFEIIPSPHINLDKDDVRLSAKDGRYILNNIQQPRDDQISLIPQEDLAYSDNSCFIMMTSNNVYIRNDDIPINFSSFDTIHCEWSHGYFEYYFNEV